MLKLMLLLPPVSVNTLRSSEMCRTGCIQKNHASYGECLRDGVPAVHGETTSKVNKGLNDYAYARSLGLQPPTSSPEDSLKTLRRAGA